MSTTIVHLSDIHFTETDSLFVGRAANVAAAVLSVTPQPKRVVVVISGDVAFSGRATEYALATRFLQELRTAVGPCSIVIAPGNHDCDFTRDDATRRSLIRGFADEIEIDDSVIANCTAVQSAFFAFNDVHAPGVVHEVRDRLRYSVCVDDSSHKIRFVCYNTAWLSRRDEEQTLKFPALATETAATSAASIVCSVVHHPYNWLQAENGRQLREHLEATSDLIFTGHEHVFSTYDKISHKGSLSYVEAGALKEHATCSSQFAVLEVDPHANEKRVVHFVWNGERYAEAYNSGTVPLVLNRTRASEFAISGSFAQELDAVDAPFTHPRRVKLLLSDVFLYPDIELRPFEQRQDDRPLIPSDGVVDFIIHEGNVLVTGAAESGKTAFAKVLFRDLAKRRLVPILLTGDDINAKTVDGYLATLKRAFGNQYDSNGAAFDTFKQLPKSDRVLLVDDLDHSRLNANGLNRFLAWAGEYFAKVVCFASELFEFRELALHESTAEHAIVNFRPCRIKEFGFVLRGRLLERWYSLGSEDEISERELADTVDRAERMMNTVLDRNLCPAHPGFLLTVLQTWEADQGKQTVVGTYGQVFEALLARALTVERQKILSDSKYTLLAMIGHEVFNADRAWIDAARLDELVTSYNVTFGFDLDAGDVRKELCNGQILACSDGSYRFAHKYVYYYFAARYIKEFMLDRGRHTEALDVVKTLTRRVHHDDSVNVLVFLLYLTKSEAIIAEVLATATELFAGVTPCDLDQDVEFVNNLTQHHPREQLPLISVRDSREHHRGELDARVLVSADDKERARAERDDVVTLNRTLKTIHVLGQILRNFPGSLRADEKIRLARETYLLGLRALNAILQQFEADWPQARATLGEFLKSQRDFEDSYQLEDSTNEYMFLFLRSLAYFFVRKISHAAGSEYLRATYDELVRGEPSVAMSLIDTSVRLDHLRPMNVERVIDVYRHVHKNLLSSSILRRLVRDHLYLYPVPIEVKQRVCSKLNIKFDNVAFLNPAGKRLLVGDKK